MTRLRDHFPIDEETGHAGPLDPSTFDHAEDFQCDCGGCLPTWGMLFIAIPIVLAERLINLIRRL